MKKIIYFISCCLLLSISILNAQDDNFLKDTYWKAILPNSNLQSLIVHFTADTIFTSNYLDDEFDPFEEYKLIGTTIYLKAIQSINCDPSIEGIYTVQLDKQLMRFELIEDSCSLRGSQAPNYFYKTIRLEPPSIDDIEEPELVSFHPIPSPDGIFYYENKGRERPKYIVYNREGDEVKSGTIHSKGQINLFHLEKGIYFITVFSELGWKTYRVVW